MLTVHHLRKSQSERIVWLCEELGIPYGLKCTDRDPVTMLAPAAFKALYPIGAAPVIHDDGVVLAESAAVVEYIFGKYGSGALAVAPDRPNYADYLYWFHFANGTLQPAMGRCMLLGRLALPEDNAVATGAKGRLALALAHTENRLKTAPYFAGDALTAADIMMVFSLTTMRYFLPVDFASYPNIRAYLQRIATHEGYRRAMRKGDPDMALLLS